jgi:YD repeat-containing protein
VATDPPEYTGAIECRKYEMRRFQFPFGLAGFLFLLGLAGLITVASAGTEKYDYDPLGRLIRFINPQGLVTRYTYDGVGNILGVQGGLQPQSPVISSVSPTQMRRGSSQQITIVGDVLSGTNITAPDVNFSISGVQILDKQIKFLLSASELAQLGANTFKLTSSESSSNFTITVNPVLPKLAISPIPIAIPPNNTSYKFIVRLGNQDNIDHTITLSIADASIAQLTSSSVNILAGSTEVTTEITGKTGGVTSLSASSPGLQSIATPVYVTADFVGFNVARALNLGVTFESIAVPPPPPGSLSLQSPSVGVTRGSVITGMTPNALSIGSGPTSVIVSGMGLGNVTGITIVPSTGLTLGSITTAIDGKSVTVPITVAQDAPPTLRQLILNGADKPYFSAGPGQDRLSITLPVPVITSIDPLFAVQGVSTMPFIVRGKNLDGMQSIQFTPASGITVGASTVISATGDAANTTIQIADNAVIGDRLVTVTTPGGTSSATLDVSNTFRVVNEIIQIAPPVYAPILGLLKQQDTAPGIELPVSTYSLPVGVSVGSVVSGISPHAKSIGDSFTLTLTGNQLEGVTSVQISPSDGLTIATPSPSSDGKSVTVAVSIDLSAPQTMRHVTALAGGKSIPFSTTEAGQFQVVPKLPNVDSIDPLYLVIGGGQATLTVRGVNFQNVQQVSALPPDGVIIGSLPVVNGDGTALTVGIEAASNATPGARTLVVTTSAGQTLSTPSVSNTITLISTAGSASSPIYSPILGVNKLDTTGTTSTNFGPFISPALGVVLQDGTTPPPAVLPIITLNPNLGVTYGPVALSTSVDTHIIGSTGTLTVSGSELNGVNKFTVSPADGITLGGIVTVSMDGKQASVPISFASNATVGTHKITLSTNTTQVPFAQADSDRFFLAAGLPHIDSIDPILIHKGESINLTIRGQNLTAASSVMIEPAADTSVFWLPVVNASGTEITVSLTVATDAASGARVVRVVTPAGMTDAAASPNNTLTILQ